MHSRKFTTFVAVLALATFSVLCSPMAPTSEYQHPDPSRTEGEIPVSPERVGEDRNIDNSEMWKDAVLRAHNVQRARYGADPLTWSDDLYPGAQDWAKQCQFGHSDAATYGENLAAGTWVLYGISDAMKGWMYEARLYDYSKPGFSPSTGHFTQVVWKTTSQVACGIAICEAGKIFNLRTSNYIVCRYSPPGNYLDSFSQNVGEPRY